MGKWYVLVGMFIGLMIGKSTTLADIINNAVQVKKELRYAWLVMVLIDERR